MKSECSSEELNQEVNDKLNQLWLGKKAVRKERIQQLTSSHSRKINNQLATSVNEQQSLFRIRDKLASEVNSSKHKDLQIEALNQSVAQLSNDKKILLHELQRLQESLKPQQGNTTHYSQAYRVQESKLNESSIEAVEDNRIPADPQRIGDTANFSAPKRKPSPESLKDLSKARLIELLRSTAQYRQFVFYYDSHELSYLRRLHEQHRKNCPQSIGAREKGSWAPTEILEEWRKANKENKLGLTEGELEMLISKMKGYYEQHEQWQLRKAREEYESKLRKVQREHGLPYDLVQICKAKERQLVRKRARTNK